MSTMKKFLFIMSLAASTFPLNAQDILVRKGGEIENVKVLEVSPTEVKFKKSNNLDGPIFVEKRSGLHSVKYQNGEVQTFEESYGQNNIYHYYSKYGKEKKLTHVVDFFVGTGWGLGYQLRREFNPYVGWNIVGISYIATEYNPTESGMLNLKLLGVSGFTPSYKWIRGFSEVNLGYTLGYESNYWRNRTSSIYHSFGMQFVLGIQLHRNIALGCDYTFCLEANDFLGARVSILF